jgi:preprotein translocase SecE subunit
VATKEIQQPSPLRTKNQPPRSFSWRKPWEEMVKFLKGVRYEFNKITWPTRQELQYNSAVVVMITVFISLYMWGVDKILDWLFGWLKRG